jgi:hypothetical protein
MKESRVFFIWRNKKAQNQSLGDLEEGCHLKIRGLGEKWIGL